MKNKTILGIFLFTVALSWFPSARAENLFALTPLGDSVNLEFDNSQRAPRTLWKFNAHWRLSNKGPHHRCSVTYTTNGWASSLTGGARLSHITGQTEICTFKATLASEQRVEYFISCEDLDKIIRIKECNGVERTTQREHP